MSKPSAYDLLKDINDSIFRLETKVDKRMTSLEDDVEVIKDWKSNLTGKISIIGAISGTVMGVITSVIVFLITKLI